METLRSSSSLKLKLFWDQYYGDRDALLTRRTDQIRFLRPPTRKHLNLISFSLSNTLHHKPIHPILWVSSLSSSDTQLVQTHFQSEETRTKDTINLSKTVHVKFQLHRECSFGQQFHIVGDDPMFGLWEPSDAVPLNWSDGHVWTAELDIPTGKSINFKFILKEGPENIIWQPGPDRILQTWETNNTITVCEDWNNAELQTISEEELTSNQNDESTVNAEKLIVAENLTQPSASQMTEAFGASTTTFLTEIPSAEKPTAIFAETITDPNEKFHIDTNNTLPGKRFFTNAKEDPVAISNTDMTGGVFLGSNGRPVNVQDFESSTKDNGNTLSLNGLPVLVPGLTPLPTSHTEEKSLKEVEAHIFTDASIEADKIKEINVPELDLKEVPGNDEQEHHQHEQVADPQLAEEKGQQNSKPTDQVLEKDIQWGRRTLQKLLANFGFQ